MRMVLFVLLAALGLATPAAACPTCACGNPALTSMGTEQPTVDRVRLSVTARAWQQDQGAANVDAVRLRELRLDVTGSWSPNRWFTVMVNVPVQLREQLAVNLERQTGFGWGEAEVVTRFVLLGSNQLRPKALLSVLAGARLPTALTLSDQERRPLDLDAQLGPGAIAPRVGLSWSGFFGDRWSAFAALTGEVPLEGRFGMRMGPSASLVTAAQFQPLRWLGLRAGVDALGELPSQVSGRSDARLAGLLGSVLADVAFRLGGSATLFVGARVPVLDTRLGPVHTWPIIVSSLVVDV
jgi:hypothetical protein